MAENKGAQLERSMRRDIEESFDAVAEQSDQVIEEFENAFEAFWKATVGPGYPPFMQTLARTNIELVGFLGRRTRAYMELPAHLARCHSPEGVIDQQARFLKEAMHDYEAASERVVRAIGNGAMQALSNGARLTGRAIRSGARTATRAARNGGFGGKEASSNGSHAKKRTAKRRRPPRARNGEMHLQG